MHLFDLDDYSLSAIVSLLSQCDSLNLSLTSRKLHPFAKRHALSSIEIENAQQLKRIFGYLLEDAPNRLGCVRTLKVSQCAFDGPSNEDYSTAPLLADVLEGATRLRTLTLEVVGDVVKVEPRVAAALCRLDQLVELHLHELTSASFELVGRLSCTPRKLGLWGRNDDGPNESERCDGTLLLSAPVLRYVRSLHLSMLRIANQQALPPGADVQRPTTHWPDLRDLKIENTYVSAATLVDAFPNVEAIHFDSRKDIEEWNRRDDIDVVLWRAERLRAGTRRLTGKSKDDKFLTVETACWSRDIDRAYGTREDFTQWTISCRVRWLMFDLVHNENAANKLLPIMERTSPVVLSLQRLPTMEKPSFWKGFAISAPRIRYLDLTLASDMLLETKLVFRIHALPALSQLPLVALRLCRVKPASLYVHDMDESRVIVYPGWRLAMRDLASDIAKAVTSLSVLCVGEGALVLNDALSRYRFCGPALWWRIVPNDEPAPSERESDGEGAEDEEGEDDDEDNDDGGDSDEEADGSDEEGSDDYGGKGSEGEASENESDEDEDASTQKLTVILGPDRSRRMVPISRDLGEHIRAYLESSKFTETSPFNDELFALLERTAVPREPVAEPY
ncbi:uncharacterized protein C8Q71DRAFT_747100 [Rhodofomes roseus]|uniref:F-box domain-containing protein n=1 Tax=Rhodofomes roseus TaxID=34475 RepID=A0ABQ8KMJ1_9APHY|nr:uncharacterized protein C8Q71DRAFT_747100 [Rhodofomes roseus]KAH9839001.1 hypothetical protein C8Q71DRAFT_747100 [Rhodofomes roseus]